MIQATTATSNMCIYICIYIYIIRSYSIISPSFQMLESHIQCTHSLLERPQHLDLSTPLAFRLSLHCTNYRVAPNTAVTRVVNWINPPSKITRLPVISHKKYQHFGLPPEPPGCNRWSVQVSLSRWPAWSRPELLGSYLKTRRLWHFWWCTPRVEARKNMGH